ncbi:MAG: endonuclease III [Candidatus Omnitrophica bacterium]|nr:endonuclease III [Candidatus Omnitrophota bacterium]
MRDSDIHSVVKKLQSASKEWVLPSVSQLGRSTRDPFPILISCLLSLRTKDQVTGPASARLFARARTPQQLLNLPLKKIRELIYPVGFYRTKARRIHQICQHLLGRFQAKVPESLEELLTLPGVGRKTANLVLTVGFGKLGICVDTHVHRISNRLGYVKTKTPEKTEMTLRAKLPKRYWIQYNDLLVSFGQTLCRPISPWCSRCPIERYCSKVGVTSSR